MLTRSVLTYPEISSNNSFCPSWSSISLPWVIYFEAFYFNIVSSFSCIPVICQILVLFLTPLLCNLSQVYSAVLLMYFNYKIKILKLKKCRCIKSWVLCNSGSKTGHQNISFDILSDLKHIVAQCNIMKMQIHNII